MRRTQLEGNWDYIPGKIKAQARKFTKSCALAKGEATRHPQGSDPQCAWLLQNHSRVFILEPLQDKQSEQSESDTGDEIS